MMSERCVCYSIVALDTRSHEHQAHCVHSQLGESSVGDPQEAQAQASSEGAEEGDHSAAAPEVEGGDHTTNGPAPVGKFSDNVFVTSDHQTLRVCCIRITLPCDSTLVLGWLGMGHARDFLIRWRCSRSGTKTFSKLSANFVFRFWELPVVKGCILEQPKMMHGLRYS